MFWEAYNLLMVLVALIYKVVDKLMSNAASAW